MGARDSTKVRPDAVALKADIEAKTTHKKGIVYECAVFAQKRCRRVGCQ